MAQVLLWFMLRVPCSTKNRRNAVRLNPSVVLLFLRISFSFKTFQLNLHAFEMICCALTVDDHVVKVDENTGAQESL